jgi:ribosome-associated protein
VEKIEISTDTINLDQFLKWAGVVDTGGQVKILIDDELILINNQVVKERRKKLRPGDIVEIKGSGCWQVSGS